jgi:hypothetical protein
LTSLDISSNNLGELVLPDGWTIDRTGYDVEMLKGEWIYKHSDGREQKGQHPGKPEGIIAIAGPIPDMGAISQFTFSGDRRDSKPVTMETSMTEADFSGKGLGLSGAIMLSAFLPKCT